MLFFQRYLLWPLLLTAHLLAVSLLSWHLLAQGNFAYALGYRALGIEQHIQFYGPQNRYKHDFAQTTPAEHHQLFGDIVRAVQNQGAGLADIQYRLPDGTYTPLLREPEVIHLQDVANLIEVFYLAGLIGTAAWLLLFVYAYRAHCVFPSPKKILAGLVGALALLTLITLLIGAEAVFYWLHIQIFPDEHEWFFYYQDSLMTTLMKAPDIFGLMSVLLVGLFVLLWWASVWAMARILQRRRPVSRPAAPPHKKRQRRSSARNK